MRCGVLGDMVIDPLTVLMRDCNMWNVLTCNCRYMSLFKANCYETDIATVKMAAISFRRTLYHLHMVIYDLGPCPRLYKE